MSKMPLKSLTWETQIEKFDIRSSVFLMSNFSKGMKIFFSYFSTLPLKQLTTLIMNDIFNMENIHFKKIEKRKVNSLLESSIAQTAIKKNKLPSFNLNDPDFFNNIEEEVDLRKTLKNFNHEKSIKKFEENQDKYSMDDFVVPDDSDLDYFGDQLENEWDDLKTGIYGKKWIHSNNKKFVKL